MTGRPASNRRTRRSESEETSYASTPGVRSRMQLQRTRDTSPEMAVRRILHAMGFRYRVDRAPLRGLSRRADIVFGPAKVAVFIDGCFWHGCPEHGHVAKSNADYWGPKIQRNKDRDRDTDERLETAGWRVVRVWEHDDSAASAEAVAREVRHRTPRRGG